MLEKLLIRVANETNLLLSLKHGVRVTKSNIEIITDHFFGDARENALADLQI